MDLSYYVYILTNRRNSVLYIGITNDVVRRIFEHKQKLVRGFTQKYALEKLVYYEVFTCPDEAIAREKQLKGWRREKKEFLISRLNPDWDDLYGLF